MATPNGQVIDLRHPHVFWFGVILCTLYRLVLFCLAYCLLEINILLFLLEFVQLMNFHMKVSHNSTSIDKPFAKICFNALNPIIFFT